MILQPLRAILNASLALAGNCGRPAGASSQPRPGRPCAIADELAELEARTELPARAEREYLRAVEGAMPTRSALANLRAASGPRLAFYRQEDQQ